MNINVNMWVLSLFTHFVTHIEFDSKSNSEFESLNLILNHKQLEIFFSLIASEVFVSAILKLLTCDLKKVVFTLKRI